MNMNYEDGVYIDNSVLIIDEKKQDFPLSARVFQFLIIAVAAWSAISVLIEILEIPCNIWAVNLAVLVSTGVFYALCLFPSYGLVKLFFGVLFYGLFLYSRGGQLLNAFYILENQTLTRISSYYEVQVLRFLADYSTGQEDTTLFVIMVLIPVVFLLTLSIVRSRLSGVSGILLFLPICSSFALGLIPSERYLIAYGVCVLYLTRSVYHYRHTAQADQKTLLHRISSQAAIWLSLISLLLFFIMKLFVSHEAYDNMTGIRDMKSTLQNGIKNFSIEDFTQRLSEIKLFTRKVYSNGLNGGELGKTGQVQYTNTRHLIFTAPLQAVEEGIYLKGYVGSVYTGSRWEGYSEDTLQKYEKLMEKLPPELFSPVNQASLFLNNIANEDTAAGQTQGSETSWYDYSFNEGVMKLQYMDANNKYLYAPYFTDYGAMDDIYYENDLYAAPVSRKDDYTVPFFYNLDFREAQGSYYAELREKLSGYSTYEKLYRNYVYQVYTQLPEEGLINIKRDFSLDRVKLPTDSVMAKIQYVRNYLNQNTEYSLSPGKLPDGKDFVEYFVYENRVGYCAHYASAATLMLRVMGVPARYVEGYAVGKENILRNSGTQETTRHTNLSTETNVNSQVEVNVMDYSAHAWVEVYFENYGWVPVEFTPGSTVDYTQTVVRDVEEITAGIEDEAGNENLNNNTPEVTVTIAPTMPPITLAPENQSTENTGRKNRSAFADLIYLAILAAVLLIGGAGYFGYRAYKRHKAGSTDNHNKRAIFIYGEIEKILHITRKLPGKRTLLEESEDYVKEHSTSLNGKELERLMEIVRKARFGKGHITGTELLEVVKYRENLYKRVLDELPLLERMRLRWRLLI